MNNSNTNNSSFKPEDKRFLIVDDDPIMRMVMKSMFKNWDHITIEIVMDGEQALEKLKHSFFDLIIMDLQMPVLNGYQTAKAIRSGECGELRKNIPILAVTADLSDRAMTKSSQMDYVLIKPFDLEKLETAILHCLMPGEQLNKRAN
ncbi:response regulator [Cyclobacterium sp. 1_MG-2023]|uniref:response regulator n=1 Tax=Cyclobacterium sp. 1_MG-2023 TaxID=3062681 RepID=UPI0026E18D05|nr:response regulator [Cyclobacterium sp. 1_MG-2023]MDO6440148.1 response regulator [Cyclobacterium sp. 1_MG-2023]